MSKGAFIQMIIIAAVVLSGCKVEVEREFIGDPPYYPAPILCYEPHMQELVFVGYQNIPMKFMLPGDAQVTRKPGHGQLSSDSDVTYYSPDRDYFGSDWFEVSRDADCGDSRISILINEYPFDLRPDSTLAFEPKRISLAEKSCGGLGFIPSSERLVLELDDDGMAIHLDFSIPQTLDTDFSLRLTPYGSEQRGTFGESANLKIVALLRGKPFRSVTARFNTFPRLEGDRIEIEFKAIDRDGGILHFVATPNLVTAPRGCP